MVRLIDADALKCEMQRLTSNLENTAESMGGQGLLCKRLNDLAEGVQRGIDMLNEQPTIEERKTGKWIKHDNGTWSCSVCQSWIPNEQHYYARFCLHCGAKMGEVKEGANNADTN